MQPFWNFFATSLVGLTFRHLPKVKIQLYTYKIKTDGSKKKTFKKYLIFTFYRSNFFDNILLDKIH